MDGNLLDSSWARSTDLSSEPSWTRSTEPSDFSTTLFYSRRRSVPPALSVKAWSAGLRGPALHALPPVAHLYPRGPGSFLSPVSSFSGLPVTSQLSMLLRETVLAVTGTPSERTGEEVRRVPQ